VTLVAHLRHDFRIVLRLLRQVPRLVHRPAERFLDVDVLAEAHRRRGDDGVHVIGRRHDDCVDIFLLVEHLPIVAVLLDARDLLVDEAPQRRLVIRRRPARIRRGLRFRGSEVAPRRRRRRRSRWTRLRRPWRPAPRLEPRIEQIEVDIAERDDVLAHHRTGIGRTHAGDADRRDVDEVARGLKAAPEHVPRDDHERRRGAGRGLHELTA
jgi:hypothetical protein